MPPSGNAAGASRDLRGGQDMLGIKRSAAALSLAGLALAHAASADTRPELRIGVVSSMTGGASAIAAGAVATINLMQERLGQDAELPFRVTFVKYDDGSDPARAVNAARKLIQEDRVHLVICCTTTPASLAVNKVVEEEKTPNLSLASAAAVIEPADQHRFTFKTPLTDRLMIVRTVDYLRSKGYRTVAFMGLEDSYGEGGWVEFQRIAGEKGMKIVSAERFARGDTNFTPQAMRVVRQKPDAVYVHAIPPSSALAHESLRRVGFGGEILHGAGSSTAALIAVGKKAIEGAVVGTAALTVYRQLPASHPIKPVVERFVGLYEGKYGAGKADLFAAQAYDTVNIPVAAYRQVVAAGKASGLAQARLALRDAIEQTREYVGVTGIYNYSPQDHLGLDGRSTFLAIVRNGRFELLK
ncbi:ABC transporter substrate-binding protein [Cupriavidus basilensis]|uniref:ABC transporter substrate-binding protein n=1 Tax=Cupriavidus basilensis TaxID=68895 RepID=UPI0012E06BDC|nr:ABC transporter substrate-binding protein [Cupriavidus basilensis]